MATIPSFNNAADPAHPGVNNRALQESPIVADVFGVMADTDDLAITLEADGNTHLPPRSVDVYLHTGGDITSTAAATKVLTDGDSVEIDIDEDGNGVFVTYVHVLDGAAAGAATAVEIAASINADAAINDKVQAVAGLTANAVTLFPVGLRAAVKTGQEITVSTGVFGFSGLGDRKLRTYTRQDTALAAGTGFSVSYVANTRVLTIVNQTAGNVSRVFAVVHR